MLLVVCLCWDKLQALHTLNMRVQIINGNLSPTGKTISHLNLLNLMSITASLCQIAASKDWMKEQLPLTVGGG